jgi:predicted ArsR family transcriptional regulator
MHDMTTRHAADRHAVLADRTRRALLEALHDAPAPLSVRDLAGGLGLHPNSVREQLQRLQAAGLVRVTRAAPNGRGRPGLRYAAAPQPEEPYRVLAGVLADQVAALPDAPAVWEAAGERWGQAAASAATSARGGVGVAGASPVPDPVGAVVGLLDDAGFAPEPAGPDDTEIRLRACPFLPLERHRIPVVCGIHLGFIKGALRELGSTRDAVDIEPFVRPDLCVARLGDNHRA